MFGDYQGLWDNLSKSENVLIIIKIIVVVLATIIILKLLKRGIEKGVSSNHLIHGSARAITMVTVLYSISKYVIYFIAGMLVLALLDINIAPILASAGVLGLAVGFGAQNLVKDAISGFFIIFDNYFSVGDYIEACGVTGFVERLGLRSTKIRDWAGEVHIFPNGEITRVTNYSQGDQSSFLDIPIAYSGNLDSALEAINQACQSMKEDYKTITDGPVVLGLDNLEKERMLIKVYFQSELKNKFSLARELRKRAKNNLDAAGVEVAPYYRILVNGEAQEKKWETSPE